jgi:hypothetical protein
MKRPTVERKVRRALAKLLACDRFLLENDVNERSVTHKLAEYLQGEFPRWNVDCEYNRVGTEEAAKVLRGLGRCRGVVNTDDTHAQTVYPDVIVHKRGRTTNLLVIEAKKDSSPVDRQCDLEKLDAYRRQLNYQFTIAVTFFDPSARPPYRLEWI